MLLLYAFGFWRCSAGCSVWTAVLWCSCAVRTFKTWQFVVLLLEEATTSTLFFSWRPCSLVVCFWGQHSVLCLSVGSQALDVQSSTHISAHVNCIHKCFWTQTRIHYSHHPGLINKIENGVSAKTSGERKKHISLRRNNRKGNQENKEEQQQKTHQDNEEKAN